MGGHQRGPGHTMDISCPRRLEAMYLSTWLGVLHHTHMPRPNERSASFCCARSTAAVATQKGGRKVLASAGVSAVLLCLVLWLLTMASLSIWHSHFVFGGRPGQAASSPLNPKPSLGCINGRKFRMPLCERGLYFIFLATNTGLVFRV